MQDPGPTAARGSEATLDYLRRVLDHPDPPQLWYQLAEIVEERTYLHHGVELSSGDLVFDVGANVGVAAAFFATDCGAEVHCFEPVDEIFTVLERNMAAFPSCHPHRYGLAARGGTVDVLYYPGAAAMSGSAADPKRDRRLAERAMTNLGLDPEVIREAVEGRYTPVVRSCEMRTLSSAIAELGIERIDLLKIDVERAELDALAGIGERDWERIRQVAAEVHDEDPACPGARALLEPHGFRVLAEQAPRMRGTDVRMVYAIR